MGWLVWERNLHENTLQEWTRLGEMVETVKASLSLEVGEHQKGGSILCQILHNKDSKGERGFPFRPGKELH